LALVGGRQVEGVVGAFLGPLPQLDRALGRGLDRRLEQGPDRARLLAAIGRDRQRLAGGGLEIAAHAAGRKGQHDSQGGDNTHSDHSSPSAARASATRFLTSSGAVPPWLARAATEASTESAA